MIYIGWLIVSALFFIAAELNGIRQELKKMNRLKEQQKYPFLRSEK